MTLKGKSYFSILAILYIWSLLISISLQTALLIVFFVLLLLNPSEFKSIAKSSMVKAFLLLTIAGIFTSIFGPHSLYGIKRVIPVILFDALLPFLFGYYAAKYEEERVKKHSIIAFSIIVSLTLIPYMISPTGFSPLINRHGFLNGFLGGKLTYAGVISAFSGILIENTLKGGPTALLLFILLIISLAVNTSRSYIFGAIFAGIVLVITKFKRFFKIGILIVIVIILGAIIFPRTRQRLKTTTPKRPDTSIQIRLSLWETGIEIVKTSPLTGIGFETWHTMADSLILKYGTPLLKNVLRTNGTNARAIRGHVHSTYLQMLLNGGVILFVFYLYLIFTMLKEGIFIENEDKKLAYFFMIIVFLFAGFFEYNFSDAEVAHSLFFFTGFYLWRDQQK